MFLADWIRLVTCPPSDAASPRSCHCRRSLRLSPRHPVQPGPARRRAAHNTRQRCAPTPPPADGTSPRCRRSWPANRTATRPRDSACDSGLLQINDVNLAWLTTQLGTVVDRTTLTDPAQNIRAAAVLCTFWTGRGKSCDYPWRPDLYRPPGTPGTTTPPTTVATMMGATTLAVPSSASPTAASTARSAAAPASGTALVQAGAYSTPAAAAQAVAALAAKGFGGFVVSGNGPYRGQAQRAVELRRHQAGAGAGRRRQRRLRAPLVLDPSIWVVSRGSTSAIGAPTCPAHRPLRRSGIGRRSRTRR